MRPRVVVYSTQFCGYCVRAKMLLADRGVLFDEVDVSEDSERRAWLLKRTGQRTVPQVFIDGEPIGGFRELVAKDRAGFFASWDNASGQDQEEPAC